MTSAFLEPRRVPFCPFTPTSTLTEQTKEFAVLCRRKNVQVRRQTIPRVAQVSTPFVLRQTFQSRIYIYTAQYRDRSLERAANNVHLYTRFSNFLGYVPFASIR